MEPAAPLTATRMGLVHLAEMALLSCGTKGRVW